eukprot:1164967-Pleurochrysis_carterae.AAC.1
MRCRIRSVRGAASTKASTRRQTSAPDTESSSCGSPRHAAVQGCRGRDATWASRRGGSETTRSLTWSTHLRSGGIQNASDERRAVH